MGEIKRDTQREIKIDRNDLVTKYISRLEWERKKEIHEI